MAQSGLLDSIVLSLVCAYFVCFAWIIEWRWGSFSANHLFCLAFLRTRPMIKRPHSQLSSWLGRDAVHPFDFVRCRSSYGGATEHTFFFFLRPFNDDRRSVSSYFGIGISIAVFCLYGAALLNVYLLNAAHCLRKRKCCVALCGISATLKCNME